MPGSSLRIAAVVLSTVMTASLLTATAAHATDSEADEIVQILESVPSDVPVLLDVETVEATELVAPGSSSTEDAAVEDVSDVSVSGLGADALDIELLAAEDAVAVSVSQGGVEVIDNGDGSSTVPLDRDDGSLQVVFVIESPDAPTSYAIDVELPTGVELTEHESGTLLGTRADGSLALGVAPAWAFDAAGSPVPTYYVVEGSEITQVVEHASGEYEYPISADPWLGQRLFSPMTVNRNGPDRGRNVYSGRLTPWGVAMGLMGSGAALMGTYGLLEFTSQWATVNRSTSLRQQYMCHAIWGRAILGAGLHWDLELSRPANANWANVAAHRCNW